MRAVRALVTVVVCSAVTPDMCAAQSQLTRATVAGAWAGWLDVSGNFQPFTASFAPGDTPPGALTNLLTGASRPLGSLTLDGQRVRFALADPRFPVLSGTLDGNTITGTAEAAGGRTGTFRLIRTAALDAAEKRRYVGAYRFADGRFLLLDIGYPSGSEMLYAVDPQTGDVRALYAMSSTEFISGPALLIPEPTEQSLSFEISRDTIMAVVRRTPGRPPERAAHVEIRQEEVRIRSGDVMLAGTLLMPADDNRHPGLVFVPSAGDIPREQYWGFGYLLAARGFAVLAFDKRGTGASTGTWRDATFEELADDVVTGARFLQSRAEVDGRRVGFWGLSQGAWIAPLAAAKFPDAAFVITLSGGGLTPAQGELFDSEYAMRNAGLSEEDIRDGLAFQRSRDAFIRTGSGWDEYAAALQQAAGRRWWRLPFTDLNGPAKADDPFWASYRKFYFYDPAPTLRQLRAPLLAIFGELDTPDGVKANVAAMTAALENGKHADFTMHVFPNGRHNLMDLGGFPSTEYPRLRRFVPGLFETMTSWLERHTRP